MRTLGLLLVLAALSQSPALSAGKSPAPPKPADINVPMAERPVVAIMAFGMGAVQRENWWGSDWDVGKGLADILTTTMLTRNRFRLIERSLLEQIIREQDLGASGRVDAKTAAKIGSIIGADYLVIGNVTQFSWDKKTTGAIVPISGIGGVGASRTKARVAVDLRLVDATTAEILGGYTGSGEESKGFLLIGHSRIGGLLIGSSDFMNTILGQATRKCLNDWCDKMCVAMDQKKLALTPKHGGAVRPDGLVVYVDGSTIIANTGSIKGYAVGDKVEIHKKIKELKDPETGELLKVLTEVVATGTVTKADQKTADIKLTLEGSDKKPAEGDIVRFVSSPEPSAPASGAK